MPTYLVRIDDDAELDAETTVYSVRLEPVAQAVSASMGTCAVDFWIEEEDKTLLLSGYIKWDGCMEFKTQRSFHLCDPKEADAVFGKLLRAIYAGAHPMFDSVDYPCPDVKNMRKA